MKDYRRSLLRFALPLVPIWVVGAGLLLFSSGIWVPEESIGESGQSHSFTAGWILLQTMIVGTLAYLFASKLGALMAATTNSCLELPKAMPTSGQAAYGRALVRVLSLAMMYLLVACFVILAVQDGG